MSDRNPPPSHVMCAPAESREAASTISVAATPAIVDGIAKHKRKRETLEQLFGRLLDRRTARELASIGQRRKSLTARIAHRKRQIDGLMIELQMLQCDLDELNANNPD